MSGGVFASTADPAAYLPYAGAERPLAALEEWAGDPERLACVLRGPAGAGKSMLLAVLAARVGRHAVPIVVTARGLDPEALARTLLDALGAPWEGSPRVALARAVARPGVRRLLLLVDDADALAPRTEMWLFDFVRRSAGVVRALLAVRDPRLAAELAAAFQPGTPVVALDVPMSREEAEAWVRAELARSDVDARQRARFDAVAVSRLHAQSGGVPGRLREEAAALLAAAPADRPGAQGAGPAALASPAALPPALAALPASAGASPAPAAAGPAARPPSAAAAPAAPHAPEARASARPLELPPAPLGLPPRPAPAARPASPAARTGAGAAPAARSHAGQEAPPPPARSHDSLLRWGLLPAALAFAYVAGFLTSQGLEALRGPLAPAPIAAERSAPAAAPPVASPPPPEAAAPPSAVAASSATDPVVAPPAARPDAPPVAGEGEPDLGLVTAAPPAGSEADLPAVSAPPPVAEAGQDRPPFAEAVQAPPPVGAAAPAPQPVAAAEGSPPVPRRRAAPRPVEVDVEAEPGAAILVDGQPVGTGTVTGLRLLPGAHRVEVRLADGRVVERIVEVKGTRYEVRVR